MKSRYLNREKLREIRTNCDWKGLFSAFDIQKDEKKSKKDDWWAKSPFTNEKTPSFHMNNKGFHCFSSGESGGKIELTQKLLSQKLGRIVDCYEAGRWFMDKGLSYCSDSFQKSNYQGQLDFENQSPGENKTTRSEKKEKITENLPIRQNIVPLLSMQGEHPEFIRRGIGRETCEYIGCGFIEKGTLKNPEHQLIERIVFQIRGLSASLKPVILSHIGRAINSKQQGEHGKWWGYGGFSKSLELYNIDNLFLDKRALDQAKECGEVLILEGCFDVAKLVEAGILNVVATLGAFLSEKQVKKISLIAQKAGINRFKVWYDRDSKDQKGQAQAVEFLKSNDFEALI